MVSRGPGELAHVPVNEVHGSYNVFAEPAVFSGPALIDESQDEPRCSLKP